MRKWLTETAWLCFIEFLAVFFQLFCYSRLGSFDLFTSALVLYATLVVFHFPFLNPYLFWFIRLGPAGKFNARMAAQCIFVVASQCLGAGCAAAASYGAETPDDTTVQMVVWSDKKWMDSNLGDVGSSKGWNDGLVFFEECVAVCAFLMGIVRVLQCEVPEMLENAERKDNTLPIKAIMYVSVLVAGLSRAFPSAHFGLHVSVFMLARGVGGAWFRVLGGCVGTLIAIVCFRVWRAGDKPPGEPNPFFQKIARLR